MKTRKFLAQLQHNEMVAAIREAEQKTSGEIRVFVSRKPVLDPLTEAQSHFLEMHMDKTRERNGVLIFVAPHSHKFAVVGDTAVHERCGEQFWNQLTAEMSQHFRDSHFTRGIVLGVRQDGALLAPHFPPPPGNEN